MGQKRDQKEMSGSEGDHELPSKKKRTASDCLVVEFVTEVWTRVFQAYIPTNSAFLNIVQSVTSACTRAGSASRARVEVWMVLVLLVKQNTPLVGQMELHYQQRCRFSITRSWVRTGGVRIGGLGG